MQAKKISEFYKNSELMNSFEELTKKILNLNETLQKQEQILEQYSNTRIEFNRFLNKNKEIYKQKLEQNLEITKKIKDNNDSLNSINNLISSLTVFIDNKKKELKNLFLKNPIYYY